MTKKLNYNKSGAAAAHRQRKRDEAAERQRARDARSDQEQLALIATRRGASKKEAARLAKEK
jgi:hypothetical protein